MTELTAKFCVMLFTRFYVYILVLGPGIQIFRHKYILFSMPTVLDPQQSFKNMQEVKYTEICEYRDLKALTKKCVGGK